MKKKRAHTDLLYCPKELSLALKSNLAKKNTNKSEWYRMKAEEEIKSR